jgi:hypothetical protein
MSYSFQNKIVFKHDAGIASQVASFMDPVLKIIETKDGFCVVTEPSSQTVKATNLFAFDAHGNELWRAAATFSAGDKNVFVDAKVDSEDPSQLVAWDWDGNKYWFLLANGQQVNRTFLK